MQTNNSTPGAFSANQMGSKSYTGNVITLNVGGVKYNCCRELFVERPVGLLPRLLLSEFYSEGDDGYFFDRDPRLFPAILHFYRCGRLHIDKTFCASQWKEEMEFWELTEETVADCCWRRYSDLLEEQAVQLRVDRELRILHTSQFDKPFKKCGLKQLWTTLEDPNFSRTSMICFILYGLLVVFSLVLFATRSYCEPRELLHERCDKFHSFGNGSGTVVGGEGVTVDIKSNWTSRSSTRVAAVVDLPTNADELNLTKRKMDHLDDPHLYTGEGFVNEDLESLLDYDQEQGTGNSPNGNREHGTSNRKSGNYGQVSSGGIKSSNTLPNCFQGFDMVDSMFEVISVVTLSIWFVLRALSCPNKTHFLKSVLNIVDFLFLLMAWVSFFYKPLGEFGHVSTCSHIGVDCYIAFLHVKMVVGSTRVFRVVKFYRGTRELWLAIRASLREVTLLAIFIGIGVLIFGSLFYCAQLVHGKPVDSVLYAYWWAVITMTTVGYGDVVPTSGLSYLVGSACAMVGLVMIALPIPIIAHNFRLYYGFRCRKKDASSFKFLKLRKSILTQSSTKKQNPGVRFH